MVYILLILIVLFAMYENYNKRKLKKEIECINSELNKRLEDNNYSYLLYNTTYKELQTMLATLNNILKIDKEMQISMDERDRKLKEMLSNISHDLKTPLTSILGFVELVNLNKEMGEVEKQEVMDSLIIKINEIIRLINNFFSLAKLENGDENIKLEETNVSEVIREVLINHYETLESLGFEVYAELDEKDIYINSNKEALVRILNNLISNVIRYGSSGKYLGISLIKDKDTVVIKTFDKGDGISQSDIKRVFERSFTGSNSRNLNSSGNGLGLAIVHSLVNELDGEIVAKSVQNVETSFTMKFKSLCVAK